MARPGYLSETEISDDDGQTWTLVSATSNSFQEQFTELETTSMNNNQGYKQFAIGLGEWTISVEALFDETYNIVRNVMLGRAAGKIRFWINRADNLRFEGDFLVTSANFTDPVDGLITISYSLRGTGVLEFLSV